jgi:hypothetical protein
MTGVSVRRRDWSEDELLVLAAIYCSASFSIGDDARDECRTMADCFGRTAGAVDRQWRNMDAVISGKSGLNIGKKVGEAVRSHLSNPVGYRKVALKICIDRSWPLQDLIIDGVQRESNRPLAQKLQPELRDFLKLFCDGISFKLFPSGAQGFERVGHVDFDSGDYRVSVTAVALGTGSTNSVQITAPTRSVSSAIAAVVDAVEPKVFPTGRVGYFGSGRVSFEGHSFQVSIQALQEGGR